MISHRAPTWISVALCRLLTSLSNGMQPGIMGDYEDREGSGCWLTKQSQQQHWSYDDRNLDYCSSYLNPLTSHHFETGLSTLLLPTTPTPTNLVPIVLPVSIVALWISWRFTCWVRHWITTGSVIQYSVFNPPLWPSLIELQEWMKWWLSSHHFKDLWVLHK